MIWACIDPANPFVSPAQAPYTIGLVYAVMVWGFASVSIGTNTARDLGCRIVAAIFYGPEVFTYHHYSWIPILVNIPASLFGTAFYELVFRDSLQSMNKERAAHGKSKEELTTQWNDYHQSVDGESRGSDDKGTKWVQRELSRQTTN